MQPLKCESYRSVETNIAARYLFGSGTHYVLFEDAPSSAFPLRTGGLDWPQGSIFAHGGNLSYDRVVAALQTGAPSVLLCFYASLVPAHLYFTRCESLHTCIFRDARAKNRAIANGTRLLAHRVKYSCVATEIA